MASKGLERQEALSQSYKIEQKSGWCLGHSGPGLAPRRPSLYAGGVSGLATQGPGQLARSLQWACPQSSRTGG